MVSMLSFSQFLLESVKFDVAEIPAAKGKIVVRQHQQEVGGQSVGIDINTFLPKYSKTREHKISFSVNGDVDRGDVSAQSGRAIWSHVENVIRSFHNENMEKRPGTHVYKVAANDADGNMKDKKDRVYKKVMERFARRVGGTYFKDGDNHAVRVGDEE